MIVFYYIINGSRCFFAEPTTITENQPLHAIVELCEPAKIKKTRCSGVSDTIPINAKDTILWGILKDFQE